MISGDVEETWLDRRIDSISFEVGTRGTGKSRKTIATLGISPLGSIS